MHFSLRTYEFSYFQCEFQMETYGWGWEIFCCFEKGQGYGTYLQWEDVFEFGLFLGV